MSVSWDVAADDLDPVFRADITALLSNDAAQWVVTSGLRTFQQQATEYAQGRTTPGEVVTNAKPGQSAHNWGLAVDVCRVVDGRRVWDYESPPWQRIRASVDTHPRLHGGWKFPAPDDDHIQSTGWPDKRAELEASGQWVSIPAQYGL